MILRLLLTLYAAGLVNALSQEKADIQGQVFITTQGQSTIKLSGIILRIYPAFELADVEKQIALAEQDCSLSNDKANIQLQKINVAEAKIASLTESFNQISHKLRTLTSDTGNLSKDEALVNDAIAKLDSQKNEAETSADTNAKILAAFESPIGVSMLFKNPLEETRSDGDGNFSFEASGDTFIVVAEAERSLFSGSEHYYWIVPIDGKSSHKGKVLLSNHNLLNDEPVSRSHLQLPDFEPSNAAYAQP